MCLVNNILDTDKRRLRRERSVERLSGFKKEKNKIIICVYQRKSASQPN